MYRSRLIPAALAAGAVLAFAACQDNPSPTSPDLGASLRVGSAQGAALPSAEDLDRQVPGFGGFFLDASGAPSVYLTRTANRAAAEQAFAGYLNAKGLSTASLHVLDARYTWQQLQRWQAAATPAALALSGAVYVDNDETTNRVVIGVETLDAMGAVRAATGGVGIPDDAVIVKQSDPIVQLASLQNVVDRPARAGVQINFPGYLCSLGFNATSGSEASFITASHCTNTQGGTEATPYWQPLQSVDGTQLATEVDDPVYFRNQNGCPRGRKCRYSDASRAAYANPANQALGQIAGTSGVNNGSLEITGTLSITNEDLTNGAVGQQVDKVGRTTGWTRGSITNTCVNTGVSGTNIVQLCQTWVQNNNAQIVGAGDSGSGMFRVTSGSSVTLIGILWGGNSSGSQLVYSPLKNVEQELGPLTTH